MGGVTDVEGVVTVGVGSVEACGGIVATCEEEVEEIDRIGDVHVAVIVGISALEDFQGRPPATVGFSRRGLE